MSSESSSELPARFIERYYPPDQLVTASRWRRLGAYLLDWLVAGVIGGGFAGASATFVWQLFRVEAQLADEVEEPIIAVFMLAIGAIFVVAVVGGYLYWWVSNWLRGQSPGKRWLRLYVIDTGGFRASGRRMLLREILMKWLVTSFVPFVSTAPLLLTPADVTTWYVVWAVIGLLPYLWILWDRDRQALWDKVTKTYVAYSPNGSVPLSRKEAATADAAARASAAAANEASPSPL